MSSSFSWTCGGGPGKPGGIVVSARKKRPPVFAAVALISIRAVPISTTSPSPGPSRIPSLIPSLYPLGASSAPSAATNSGSSSPR